MDGSGGRLRGADHRSDLNDTPETRQQQFDYGIEEIGAPGHAGEATVPSLIPSKGRKGQINQQESAMLLSILWQFLSVWPS